MRTRSWLSAAVLLLLLLASPAAAATRHSRFDLAGRCLRAGPRAEPLFFKATGLGTYLIGDRAGRLLTATPDGAMSRETQPSTAAVWRPERVAPGRFRLRSSNRGRLLVVGRDGALATGDRATRL